jgi:hypothetical protein
MIHVFISIFILVIKVRRWMKVWIDILCGKGMSRKGKMYNLYLIFAKRRNKKLWFHYSNLLWAGSIHCAGSSEMDPNDQVSIEVEESFESDDGNNSL